MWFNAKAISQQRDTSDEITAQINAPFRIEHAVRCLHETTNLSRRDGRKK
jgi:hypothetical protein